MNQLQDLYEYLNKASMSGMSERSANHVSAAIALVKQMMQAEPVTWQYRNIVEGNPVTKWADVVVRNPAIQTMQDQIHELLSYRYNNKPCYEIRALYAAPQAVPADGFHGCACRLDKDDKRVATCVRHQGWLDVVSEWSERAKNAEAMLAAAPKGVV